MDIGELKEYDYDGKHVWMKRIAENLYFVNDMYCYACDSLDMEDLKVVMSFLWEFENPAWPYRGASTGDVYAILEIPAGSGKYLGSLWRIEQFGKDVAKTAKKTLDEYRKYFVA